MVSVAEAVVSRGVVERRFDIETPAGPVPGIVWTPEGADGPRPLVLFGHGGTQHKRAGNVLGLARRIVRHHGFAAAAIDALRHGDRRTPEVAQAVRDAANDDTITALVEVMGENSVERMCADWSATLAALRALPEIGDGPVGYWGLSLGTVFGIPLVAAEPQIQVAVLGLMGAFRPIKERLRADAAKIRCPVLYLLQTDDELVPFGRGIGLFLDIGTKDKRLHAHPGRHSAVPAEEAAAMEDFLARHLAHG